ncbi:MAG TPA: CPBP family intramembrane glutamic endopeptidase, partial [Phycisphaerae bacterium]|nr:CPBP family intramembrane glutamic endopeptidase [Phycisphaerae bacterium]
LLLAVLVAPVLEEYLFRGLLYRGLQRSFHPAVAVAGSAAVFAVIHPPIAILPVFGLGVAAAISFRRTGLLLAPITAHVTYNLLVMAAAYVLK